MQFSPNQLLWNLGSLPSSCVFALQFVHLSVHPSVGLPVGKSLLVKAIDRSFFFRQKTKEHSCDDIDEITSSSTMSQIGEAGSLTDQGTDPAANLQSNIMPQLDAAESVMDPTNHLTASPATDPADICSPLPNCDNRLLNALMLFY